MNTGIRIHEIKLSEQTPMKDMFLRTWSTDYKNFSDNVHLQEALVDYTSEGTNLSPQAMAPIANSILVPDAKISQLANIGGSYNERRFAVQITIEVTDSQMLTNYEIITGYTDHMGFSDINGVPLFDDNMLIFINGVADLTRENAGGSSHWDVRNITQVLTPITGSVAGETHLDTNMVTCRPIDTLGVMASKVLTGLGSRTSVSSMLMTSDNKRSSRENNVAANYLSKTVSSYRDQMIDGSGNDEDAILNAAANPLVADPANTASSFLRELRRQTQYRDERAITWSELRKLDPTLRTDDMRIKPVLLKQNAFETQMALVGGSENWNSAWNETIVAQQAMNTIPAFMSQRLIGQIVIEAHNATTDGSVVTDLHSIQGIRQDVDLLAQKKFILNSFVVDVFSQLLQGNIGRTLYIKASMGLAGTAEIIVGLDGGIRRPYSAALFNDASWSPCLAAGHLSLANLAQDLDVVCSTATSRALGAMTNLDAVMSGTSRVGGRAGAGGNNAVIGNAKPAASNGNLSVGNINLNLGVAPLGF